MVDPGSEVASEGFRPFAFMRDTLRIRAGEGRRVGILFLQIFATGGIFVLGRTVRDTLFLSRYSIAALPWMFVFYGMGAALVSMLYGRYADRISRSRLLYATSATGIVTYAGVWLAVRAGVSMIYPLFYIWSEIVSNLLILQFWTLAAELDPPRDARRLNATIGAARPLGTVFFGLGAGWIVPRIGTSQLLFALILLMVFVALCVHKLRHEPRVNEPGPSRHRPSVPGAAAPLERSYVRALSLLMLIMFLALTLGDFQFKMIARASYREDSLAQFFSLFYAVVGLLSMVFQLFLTPILLSKLGVGSALTVLPAVFGTSSVMLLIWPGLPAACSMKFADNGLQFTLHDTTMQSLYSPFSPAVRGRMRAFLDGAIKPLSYGAGGLLLVVLLYLNVDVRQISFVTVPLAVAWQALIPLVRRGYLQLLERGLAGPMAAHLFVEPLVLGAAERRILIQTVESGDARGAMVALEQLRNERSVDFRQALHKLLRHPESALRAHAISLLDAMDDSSAVSDFAIAAQDPDPAVRCAAAAALARILSDENPELILPFLDDPSREVRIRVLSCLIQYGGIEGSTRAGNRLLVLIESDDADQRKEACSVLARLGHSAFHSIKNLLQDPVPGVRRAAMRAAAGTADSHLVPAVIGGLYDSAVCKTAMGALVSMGDPAVPFIEQAMREPKLPRSVRLQLPRVLSRIPSSKSFVVLREFEADTDSHFRLRVLAALGRLRSALGYAPIPPALLVPRVRREALEVYGNAFAWNQARTRFATTLLTEEMNFRRRRSERRILRLLEMSYSRREISVIIAALENPERRAGALDALEALLTASLREEVIPVLEMLGSPDPGHSRTGSALSFLPAEPFMLMQTFHPNPYVNFLALDALSKAGERAAIPCAQHALSHSDPLVREAALCALARLDPPGVPRAAARLASDSDSTVRRWAAHFGNQSPLTALEHVPASTEDVMISTVEKILFLKGTPLFSGLPGEDLAPLARVAEVVRFSEGDIVIRKDEPGDYFFIVISGLILLESEGTELRRVGTSGVIGELAVLDRSAQSCTARALQPSELLRIGAEEFFEVLHEQTEIAEALIRILACEVREAQQDLVKRTRQPANTADKT